MAPFQSLAASACLPAAKSGSSGAQAGPSVRAPIVVQIGQLSTSTAALPTPALDARSPIAGMRWAAPTDKYRPSATTLAPINAENIVVRVIVAALSRRTVGPSSCGLLLYTCATSSFRHESFGLSDFRPFGIGVLGQIGELAEMGRGLVLQTGFLSGLRGAIEPAQSVRGRRVRSLVLFEGLRRLLLLKEQIAQQLAHRIEPVLHGDVLLAVVLEVRRGAHELQRFIFQSLGLSDPGRCSQDLDFDLFGPIRLVGLFERGAQFLELGHLAVCCIQIAAAGGPHGAGEISDRLGLWELAAARFQRRGLLPSLTLKRIARRHRRQRGVAREEIKTELLDVAVFFDDLLGTLFLPHLQKGILNEIQVVRF